MKCTCDSRDLFNFGCRCKKEGGPPKLIYNGSVVNIDPIDIGSMHGLSIPAPDKFINLVSLMQAIQACGASLDDAEKLGKEIWRNLR